MAYDVTKRINSVSALQVVAQTACKLFFQELFKAGVTDVFLVETLRPQERQNYLYSLGRTRPGKEVTWTLNSNHTPGYAWDIGVCPPKDLYDRATIDKCGAVAKKLGITWGGSWQGQYDSPHFEVKSNWVIPKGYKLEGEVLIPTSSKDKIKLIIPNQKEEETVQEFLNDTGREELKQLITKGVQKGLINKSHLAKLNTYADKELISYASAVLNRSFK